MKKLILCTLVGAALLQPAYSSGLMDGIVLDVRVDKSGYGFIRFDRALTDVPANCIQDHGNHLSFNLNTPGGEGVQKLALYSKATGQPIRARGTGTCDEFGVVESWAYGWIH